MQKHATYLLFLNTYNLPVRLVDVIAVEPHTAVSMTGWQGIVSLRCVGSNKHLYDIDVRLAWGNEIFQQHLVDFGWTERLLLTKKHKSEPLRHKIIVYLCQPTTGQETNTINEVPSHLLVGNYWSSIHHFYIAMPPEHPFDITGLAKQTDQLGGYATTRSLIQRHSEIVPSPSSLPVHPQRGREGGLRTRGHTKQAQANAPLVSVITVVFQGTHYLEQTIQSVINQTYSNIEYIIIDGGSTDGTLDIIKKYEDCIDYWVSEPDRGIYDAMNKGTAIARGDWVIFLGSDDFLIKGQTIERIFTQFHDLCNTDIIVGHVYYTNGRLFLSHFDKRLLLDNSVHHQGTFYKREVFRSFSYDTEFRVSSDYELNLKLFCEQARCINVQDTIAICGDVGTSGHSWLGYAEEIKIRHRYLSPTKCVAYDLQTILRFLTKRFIITLQKSINL